MNFKTLFFLGLAALAFGACGDDDDAPMTTQTDLLIANNWVYVDLFLGGNAIGFESCLGDDFLSFNAAGAVVFDNAMESDTCTVTLDPYSGTFEVRNDSLLIRATNPGGGSVENDFDIVQLDATELRVQSIDPLLGLIEVRYTVQ
ncbi:MAG: lipocalin family protein [Saprospiraceae bacterium]